MRNGPVAAHVPEPLLDVPPVRELVGVQDADGLAVDGHRGAHAQLVGPEPQVRVRSLFRSSFRSSFVSGGKKKKKKKKGYARHLLG